MNIEERLEVLERELAVSRRGTRRMWVTLGLAGAVCAIVWSLTAVTGCIQTQGVGNTIRANAFIVEDGNGKARAKMSITTDGPGLALYDENGTTRALLSAIKGGPMLSLYDENGKTRALLGINKDGQWLGLFDENGKVRAHLGINKDGPRLCLSDVNENPRAALAALKDGPRLELYKPDGKVIWSAP